MRWHWGWGGASQAGLGTPRPASGCHWARLVGSTGWASLSAFSSRTFGISGHSYQAQPSEETVSVVILCQNFMRDTGVTGDGDCT